MATPTFLTGFEHGVISSVGSGLFSAIAASGGTLTAQTAIKRSGLRALQVAKTGTGTCFVAYTPAGRQVVTRVYLYFDDLPTANMNVLSIGHSSAACTVSFRQSDSRLRLSPQSGTIIDGPVIVADTWYRIDIHVDASANPWVVKWQVDGSAQTDGSAPVAAADLTFVRLGSSTTDLGTPYYDDWMVSLTAADYPLGPGQIIDLKPNADGTHSIVLGGFADASGALISLSTAFDDLDDVPIDESATYVAQPSAAATEYVEVAFEDRSDIGTINGVRAVVALSADGTAAFTGGEPGGAERAEGPDRIRIRSAGRTSLARTCCSRWTTFPRGRSPTRVPPASQEPAL
jgi:hypothetical protein